MKSARMPVIRQIEKTTAEGAGVSPEVGTGTRCAGRKERERAQNGSCSCQPDTLSQVPWDAPSHSPSLHPDKATCFLCQLCAETITVPLSLCILIIYRAISILALQICGAVFSSLLTYKFEDNNSTFPSLGKEI